MIRLRRAAPVILGTLLVCVGMGLSLTAAAAPVGSLTLDDVMPAVGPTLAFIGGLLAAYRGIWAAMRAAAKAEISLHDAKKDAHLIASTEQHRPLETTLDELHRGMERVLARLDVVSTLAAEVQSIKTRLRVIEDRHLVEEAARNPADSPYLRRASDQGGADYSDDRGRKKGSG